MDRSVEFFEKVFGWRKEFELHHENGDPWIVYLKICKGHFLELFYGGQNDRGYALDFYCNRLGLKLIGIQDNEQGQPWLYYVRIADGVYLELIPNGEGENPNKGWNSRGFNHLCLETDNLLEDVERFRSSGIGIVQEPKTSADRNWQAWIADPDGNKIELMMIDPDSPRQNQIESKRT